MLSGRRPPGDALQEMASGRCPPGDVLRDVPSGRCPPANALQEMPSGKCPRNIDWHALENQRNRAGQYLGLWRNGSASDSRSEGWAFESLWPHLTNFITHQQPRTKQKNYSNVYYDERDHDGLPNNQCVVWENVRMPGVEPGSQAWEACMMPLHYMRLCKSTR